MRPNTLRSIWERGEAVLNGWLHIGNGFAAEVMAHAGWDSLTIDLQHGPLGYAAALTMLQAISTTATIPLARVPWNEPGIIMKLLDAGCYGIICPMINTGEEAERFVQACRYPPQGYRSYGPTRVTLYAGADYAQHANAAVITMAMIETVTALNNLDDILAVPGLDAVYVGPADLSQSLGLPPQVDSTNPQLLAALDTVVASARRHGVIAGLHTAGVPYATQMIERGFRFTTIMSDARLLATAAATITATMKATGTRQATTTTTY